MTSRRVYSTDSGRMCPDCDKPVGNCVCRNRARQAKPNPTGTVIVRRETKGRKGAGVTIVDGLALDGAALKTLAKKLKQACSSGGAIKDGSIEIQGDHRDRVKKLLEQQSMTVKISGG